MRITKTDIKTMKGTEPCYTLHMDKAIYPGIILGNKQFTPSAQSNTLSIMRAGLDNGDIFVEGGKFISVLEAKVYIGDTLYIINFGNDKIVKKVMQFDQFVQDKMLANGLSFTDVLSGKVPKEILKKAGLDKGSFTTIIEALRSEGVDRELRAIGTHIVDGIVPEGYVYAGKKIVDGVVQL